MDCATAATAAAKPATRKQKPPSLNLNLNLILTLTLTSKPSWTEDLTEETLTRTDIEQLFIAATKPEQRPNLNLQYSTH
jgi:hypothetical protein